METSANGGSRTTATTAHHRPTPDSSAPPGDDAEPCDLVTVPARQGLEAVDILRRGAGPAVGPVLHDGTCDTLGFLVPPGTADGWDMPGSACTQTSGRGLRIPAEPRSPALAQALTGCSRRTPPTRSPIRWCCARRSARRPASSRPPTSVAEPRSLSHPSVLRR